MDFAAQGLLDGLEGDERRAREQLLARLVSEGVGLDELRSAVAEDRLALVPVERVLGGTHTAAEVSERTGLPVEVILRVRGLLGLPVPAPDDRVFSDEDVAAATLPAPVPGGRLRGAGDRRDHPRPGRGDVSGRSHDHRRVRGDVPAAGRRRAGGGAAVHGARAAADPGDVAGAGGQLQRAPARGGQARDPRPRRARGRATSPAPSRSRSASPTSSGFTRLGGEVEASELGSVAVRFGELATHLARPPVRLIKTIGDAAMLVSPDPAALVSVALELVDGESDPDLPSVRAGIAGGFALARARRLLRSRRQPGQPGHRHRSSRQRAVHAGRARRGRGAIRLVVCRTPPLQGHRRGDPAAPGAASPARGDQPARSYWTFNRSTTKTSVELAGIVGGLPFAP